MVNIDLAQNVAIPGPVPHPDLRLRDPAQAEQSAVTEARRALASAEEIHRVLVNIEERLAEDRRQFELPPPPPPFVLDDREGNS